MCGEQHRQRKKVGAVAGSSPRVRGTVGTFVSDMNLQRFIPACAGNSMKIIVEPMPSPVHPRVCGEQGVDYRIILVAVGSSPRVRGTASHLANDTPLTRFIPACAGNRTALCVP